MHRLLAVLMETAMLQAAGLNPFPLTIPIAFEENWGQSHASFTYVVTHANAGVSCDAFYGRTVRPYSSPLYSTRFVNANRRCMAELSDADGSVSRYYRGRDGGGSSEALPRYRKARFRAVWPGVDVEYTASDAGIEVAFHLNRASNLGVVRLQANGVLEVTGEQNGAVAVRAQQDSERITSFTASGVNAALPLTLRMQWLPSMDREIEQFHGVDGDGNRYVGSTIIAYEDLRPNPAICLASSRVESCPDLYVASFAPSGRLRYVVYLLGSRYERMSGIAVDAGGNVFVAGTTYSQDFVTTAGAYQSSYTGPESMQQVGRTYAGGDAFVTKLHGPSGGLIYSTYVGTAGSENVGFLHADGHGQATILVGTNTPGLPSIGEAIVENPNCCTRLIGMDEAGGALRYAVATRSWQVAGARDGSMAIAWPDYPNESGRNELALIGADGSLRYRRTIRGESEYAISDFAFRPDGSMWLASYRQTGTPRRAVWDMYQVTADGEDQIFIATTPAANALWPDEDGGFWLAVGGAEVPPTAESVMENCPQCGGLLHYDSSGTLRFGTVVPIFGNWLGVARDYVYCWANYSGDGSFLSYVLDQSATPGPVLAAVVNPNGGTAQYVAGGVLALLGARLGPREEVRFPVDESGRAATRVGGVRVLVGGRACVILSAGEGRLMVLLPLTLPGYGQGLLTVEQNERPVFALPVQYSSGVNPTVLGGPYTPAGLGVWNEDGTLNGPDNPAPSGSVFRFYVVGVGKTDPPAVEGEVVHGALAKPVANIDIRFSIGSSGYPLLSLQQAAGYVTGIYEAKFQLRPLPLEIQRLPISLGIAGTLTWQVSGPYVYVR